MRIASLADLPEQLRPRAAAELEKQGMRAPGAKAGKYGNQRIMVGDETFDSKLEYACYQQQIKRRGAGEISWFLRQVSFPLPGGVRYRCDFLTHLTAGGIEVIDAKGMLTKEFVIKAKQLLAVYRIDILLWKRRSCRPFSQRRNP